MVITGISSFNNVKINVTGTGVTKWKFLDNTGTYQYIPITNSADLTFVSSSTVSNTAYGRMEVYYNNEWTSLVTVLDMAGNLSVTDTSSSDNITLTVLADIIQDFFASAVGGFYAILQGGVSYANPNYLTSGSPWSPTGYVYKTAQAYPIIGTGMIANITITNGGSGYTYPPIISITDSTGSGAYATTIIKNGILTGITMVSYGSNYTNPIISFSGDGSGATGTAVLGGGQILKVGVVQPGITYGVQVILTDSLGLGSGAFANATIRNGVVVSLNITSGGTGYGLIQFTGNTTTNSVTLTNISSTTHLAIGQTITGTGILSGTTIVGIGSNTITLSKATTITATAVSLSVQIQSTSVTITALGDGGSGATGTATVVNGVVTTLNITAGGSGYSPTITLNQPATTTFTAQVTAGSPILTNVSSVASISNGMLVTGTGIPANSYILSIGSNTVTMSLNGLSTVTPTVTASSVGSGAIFDITVDGGAVTNIVPSVISGISNFGINYPSTTSITISPVKYTYYETASSGRGATWYFSFNIFDVIGIPYFKRQNYKVSLFSGLNAFSDHNYYSSGTIFNIQIQPAWSFGSTNEQLSTNYGVYNGSISLSGNDSYHSSHVGSYWYARATKFQNF